MDDGWLIKHILQVYRCNIPLCFYSAGRQLWHYAVLTGWQPEAEDSTCLPKVDPVHSSDSPTSEPRRNS